MIRPELLEQARLVLAAAVCGRCEGRGWVTAGSALKECPVCEGTGEAP